MTRNLKALGLALLAVFALGAIGAQGASAADHKFHSDGPRTIITGTNTNNHEFTVGAVGTVKCEEATFESQQAGAEVSANTYQTATITVVPKYNKCSFGGQPATVFFNHCAYVFTGKTTLGNPTGGEHANAEIECETGDKIQVHTVNCTITVGPQVVKHAVRYENEFLIPSATRTFATGHEIVVGKERNTASQPVNGCLLFPTGPVGKYTGAATNKCFRDDGSDLTGTNKTTPSGTEEGSTTDCTVSGAPTV